jgi:hypothetical protein
MKPTPTSAAPAQDFGPATAARWSTRLRQPGSPAPTGLCSWNGSDPAQRFAVHRNNVLAGLSDALAALPWLGDLARLEWLRQRCCHAADAPPLPLDALAQRLATPQDLPSWRPGWHPAAAVWRSRWAGLSLWSAHQRANRSQPPNLSNLDLQQPEAALLMRSHEDDKLHLWPLTPPAAAFCDALAHGADFGSAQRHASAAPGADRFDLSDLLALLLRQGALTA